MAEYLIEYTDKADRLAKIEYQEKTLKRQMLHDNFTATGGVMTFIDPIPPTAEELARKALLEQISKEVDTANDQALVTYQNFDSLTTTQKDKILKALLGDYIRRHPEKYL